MKSNIRKRNDSKKGEIISLMLNKFGESIKYLSESTPMQLKMAETERWRGKQPINYFQFSVPLTNFFIFIL